MNFLKPYIAKCYVIDICCNFMPYQAYYCAASQWLTKSTTVPTHAHHRTDVAQTSQPRNVICSEIQAN